MKTHIPKKVIGFSAAIMVTIAVTTGCDDIFNQSNPTLWLLRNIKPSTVTFDSQDAEVPAYPSVMLTVIPAGTVEALPSAPAKTGQEFAGWSTEPNGGGTSFTEETRVTGDITVYPVWSTPGLKFTLINGGAEYSVEKGSADTSGTVVIPGYWSGKKVTAVGAYGFSHCAAMTGVSIPDHVTTIGESAFYGCTGLSGVTLPGQLAVIGQAAFYSCTGLAGIAVPGNVTDIGPGAFAYCSGLTDLTFAAAGKLATIGELAFGFCTNLTHTELPGSITAIEHRAFYSCTNLTELIANSVVPPELCICVFFNCPSLHAIRVPAASVETYKSTDGWNSYADFITAL